MRLQGVRITTTVDCCCRCQSYTSHPPRRVLASSMARLCTYPVIQLIPPPHCDVPINPHEAGSLYVLSPTLSRPSLLPPSLNPLSPSSPPECNHYTPLHTKPLQPLGLRSAGNHTTPCHLPFGLPPRDLRSPLSVLTILDPKDFDSRLRPRW